MLSKEKLQAMKYLKSEFTQLQNDPSLAQLGCSIGLVNSNDFFHWKFTLVGPSDTAYANGFFFLTADFRDDYPKHKPEVRFINKIYHLNVSPPNGHVSISTLNSWKEGTPFLDVIAAIYILFYNQNPLSPYSGEMSREYQSNRSEFDRKVKEWTKEYASFP